MGKFSPIDFKLKKSTYNSCEENENNYDKFSNIYDNFIYDNF